MAAHTVVVRVWLPDRPGALGAVASRIGAVHGDVIAIDVLERGGGRAVDELTVELPDASLVDLLLSEIGQVDGVDVEDVRERVGDERDRAVAAVAAAVAVAGVDDADDLWRVTCRATRDLTGADWVTVLDTAGSELRAMAGTPTSSSEWLAVFVQGAVDHGAVDELAFWRLDGHEWLVLARSALPLRSAERDLVEQLAALAAQRLAQLRERSTARSHWP
jgi:hypothetical protein